ncbi:MAG TPA: macrolide ABC transporter ATP-binding protein, partial [Candidatus Methanoperedenaceae archaeon]|nr:macrolide ABC transporter ATP-binding protein [Candidatus Methanoperedenaceae archaeon]
NRPAVILADEPTGEVDSKTRDMIIGILASLSEQGNTVIVVTHDPAVAEKTARRIVMRDGSVISDSVATAGA